MVSAQQNGVIIGATRPSAASGEFFLARLVPGTYDVVVTADNLVAAVIASVPVATATTTVILNTKTTAIDLTTSITPAGIISGVVTLNPASSTEAAYVSAKQSFTAGPTVTIQYQGADIVSGEYSLSNLPTVAPQFAVYSATSPLQFSTPTGTLPGNGKYIVEAAASGYQSKVNAAVDIFTGNQAGINFTLAP